MHSPIKWFGGKGIFTSTLLQFLPVDKSGKPKEHVYVEVFGGGASLLFAKPPAPVEVYNDLDSGLVNLFRVLRDPEMCTRVQQMLELTPYSREEYYAWRDDWATRDDPVERAYGFYLVARQSFGGRFGSGWRYSVTATAGNKSHDTSAWLSAIERLPEIRQRLFRCQIEHDDFRAIIPRYGTPETLFYCDPPYVGSTRKGGKYKHELTMGDHRDLLKLLHRAAGMVLLSGYRSGSYLYLEDHGWVRHDFDAVCHATGKVRKSGLQGKGSCKEKQSRVESVWINPALQEALKGGTHE